MALKLFQIKSFRGGIADYENRGIEGSFKNGSGLDIRRRIDSLKCSEGFEEMGVVTDGVDNIDQLIYSFVQTSINNPLPALYAFGSYRNDVGGKVWQLDYPSGKKWKLVYQLPDSEGGISDAAEWPSSSGKKYLYFASNFKLHRKELIDGDTSWDNVDSDSGWPKDLDGGYHKMIQTDGDLAVTNLHKIALVGYDESFSNNVLDLGPLNAYPSTLVNRNNHLIIGNNINAAIDTEVPLAQVGDNGEIYFADMIESLPITAFTGGGVVYPNGVATTDTNHEFFEWQNAYSSDPDINTWINRKSLSSLSYWGVHSAEEGHGGIWSYGRKKKNQPFCLNLEYPFDTAVIGALHVPKFYFLGKMFFSYQSNFVIGSTNFGIKNVKENLPSVGSYESLDLQPEPDVPAKHQTWKYVELNTAPLPESGSIDLYFRMNKQGDWIQAKTTDGYQSFSYDNANHKNAIQAIFAINEVGKYMEIKIVLTKNGSISPEVYAPINIFYE